MNPWDWAWFPPVVIALGWMYWGWLLRGWVENRKRRRITTALRNR